MGLQLNSNEIAEILPHRYPFALVDRITDGESGAVGQGYQVRQRGGAVFLRPFSAEARDARCPDFRGHGAGGGSGYFVPAGEPGEDRPVRRCEKRPVQAAGNRPVMCWSWNVC